jgi:hypothetical protein
MASSNDGGHSDFPDVLGNDELAANLIKCATLVKRGEKQHPLLRQTIQDMTYFVTGYHVRHGIMSNGTSNAAMLSSNISASESPQSTTLSKKHISVTHLANGVLSNLGIRTGGDDHSSVGGGSVRTEAEKSATSMKNAERAKSDVHRVLGSHTPSDAPRHNSDKKPLNSKKPPFQRPSNPSSALIANGWIEQQRRSKLRVVWKEVLASLVEGRKPGEDTTLWIQREYYSHSTGKMELEALHQIPIKFLREISYQSYTTDHRFLLKVKNMNEDFIFRCEKSEEAAQSWVTTIRSLLETTTRHGKPPVKTALDSWEQPASAQQQMSNDSSVSFEEEKKVPEHQLPPRTAAPPAASMPPPQPTHHPPPPSGPHPNAAAIQQMSISEMRAIAHGAGVQTHGMERGELEHIVYQIHSSSIRGGASPIPPPTSSTASPSYVVPPGAPPTAPLPSPPTSDSNLQRNISDEEVARRIQQEEVERQQQIEEAARRRKLANDAARSRAAVEAQQNYIRQQQQEAVERQKREEERKRMEAERLRREEEEHQRRVAEQQAAEQRRRLEEQQRQQQAQWQQQQHNWQQQQVEEKKRRMAEDQKQAEEKRRQEEAFRAQQQWQQKPQQPNGNPSAQQWQQAPPPRPYGPSPPPYGPSAPAAPPPHPGMGHPPPPPPPHTGDSPVNLKYAKMASQSVDGGQRSLQVIKHGILVEWALLPPAMQILRPIEILITTVHGVFPPKFGVTGHDHFNKWSVVTLPEVLSGAQPDCEKLSKVVRKLRFILHPDKLPREFDEGQTYLCKMLWDIVSDAFEDHKKKEEELAWMR